MEFSQPDRQPYPVVKIARCAYSVGWSVDRCSLSSLPLSPSLFLLSDSALSCFRHQFRRSIFPSGVARAAMSNAAVAAVLRFHQNIGGLLELSGFSVRNLNVSLCFLTIFSAFVQIVFSYRRLVRLSCFPSFAWRGADP